MTPLLFFRRDRLSFFTLRFSTMAVTFSQPQEEKGINVFVRSTYGKTQCLLVDPYKDSVAETKRRLKEHTLDSVWICNGKPLEDEARLADYGLVGHGVTIESFPRQRGGCFMVSLSILFIIMCAIVGSMCTCGLSLVVVPFLMPLLFVLPLFCL